MDRIKKKGRLKKTEHTKNDEQWSTDSISHEEVFTKREGYITVVIHHGGDFKPIDKTLPLKGLDYQGDVSHWECDPDRWSYFEVLGILKEKNYSEIIGMWYDSPTEGLKVLDDDVGAMDMVTLANHHGEVHLYLVHSVPNDPLETIKTRPQFIFEDGLQQETFNGPDQGVHVAEQGVQGENFNGPDQRVHKAEQGVQGENFNGPNQRVHEAEQGVQGENFNGPDQRVNEAEQGVQGADFEEEILKIITFDDSEEELDDINDGFDHVPPFEKEPHEEETRNEEQGGREQNEEQNEEQKIPKKRGRPTRPPPQQVEPEYESGKLSSEDDVEVRPESVRIRGLSDSEYDSDELNSESDTNDDEDDEPRVKFATFKMPKDMTDYQWEPGTYFVSRDQFRDAIVTYAVHSSRQLSIPRCDLQRVKVVCSNEECRWMAYCVKLPHEETWQLRKLLDKHDCCRVFKIKLLNAKWLSKKLLNSVRQNPKIKLTDIQDRANKKWNAGVSKLKAYRARKAAIDIVDGSFREQYTRLFNYAHELMRSNPGSTVKIKTVAPLLSNPEEQNIPHFQRIYVCLGGCKESFKKCRTIIGLDGCFLKGYYGGQLLTAIGRDPNDQMLPIAYAVVESECKESWGWFLEILIDDLGGVTECQHQTFISDQQKGLLPALQELLPGVDQRFCVRHLYNNFRKKYPGKQLKDMMWRAAKSTYPQAWERRMREIKLLNLEAFKHLMQVPPRHWSKSRFKPETKCDTLLNNMCESFNSVIVGSRSKPVVTLLEEIRIYLMERWEHNRFKIAIYEGDILPRIKKRLAREAEFTKYWMPRLAGDAIFEVRHINLTGDKYVVHLGDKNCSCRKWSITGVPCSHAICCMRHNNINPEEFIPDYYRRQAYEACYSPIIYPTNGSNLWPKTSYTDLQPPPIKRQPGRPKKKRNKDASELIREDGSIRRTGLPQKCSKCQKSGHNRATCPLPPPTRVAESSNATGPQVTQPTQGSATASQPTTETHTATTSQPTIKRKYTAMEKGKSTLITGGKGNENRPQSQKGIVINEPSSNRKKFMPVRPIKPI